MRTFTDEDELELIVETGNAPLEEDDYFRGCPDCQTDEYLMDMEEKFVVNVDFVLSNTSEHFAKEWLTAKLEEFVSKLDLTFIINHADSIGE